MNNYYDPDPERAGQDQYIKDLDGEQTFDTTADRWTEKSTGRTWRRNGKTQTWKTRPGEFRIPVKFGLYGYGAITHLNCDDFEIQS